MRLQLCETWNFAAKSIPYAPALSEGLSEGGSVSNCICRLSCATKLSVEERYRSTPEGRTEGAAAVLATVIQQRVEGRGLGGGGLEAAGGNDRSNACEPGRERGPCRVDGAANPPAADACTGPFRACHLHPPLRPLVTLMLLADLVP